MEATDGYMLEPSEHDKHVMTSEHSNLKMLSDLIRKAETHESLAQLIKLLSQSASVIDNCSYADGLPSQRLLNTVNSLTLEELAASLGITRIEALGKIVRDCIESPAEIRFLSEVPPAYIHAMQRGPYWIGDIYTADLIVSCLRGSNLKIQSGQRFLDLGCSSGSMLRILAWNFPDVDFLGCDPVDSSIEWAQKHLMRENLKFFHQKQNPPIDVKDGTLDYVSAISIFSHHGMLAAVRWFSEVHRVLKTGGLFFFTTHGEGSILWNTLAAHKPLVRYQEIYAAFLANGYVFEEVWLGADDSGNAAIDSEWGNSFYSVPVVVGLLCKKFEILFCGRRSNQSNQDVYIVRKLG